MNTFRKKQIGLFISLLMITLLMVMQGQVVYAESEPNNSFATADPISIGLDNAETGATLTTDDSDYYVFTAEAGRTYVIETFNIQGTGSDATGIWLYDNTQALITNDQYGNNGTGNANARITYTFSTSGTYFILVKDCTFCTWTGTYSLRILPKYDEPGAAWDATNDDEPNDVLVLAKEIQVGLPNAQTHQLFNHTNYVTSDSDHDYYHFTAIAGSTYVIETFNIQGTGSDATGLWLYDASGAPITDDRYGNNGTGNANARITYTFSTSGTYFILVKDCTFCTWTGTYSLRVLPKYDEPGAAWDSTNDDEPNDVLALANEIQVGTLNAQTHQLFNNTNYVTSNSDHDYYHFTAEAGKTYVIQTFGIQATSRATGLWLYNNSGTLLANDQYGDSGNGTAKIVHTFVATGEYFFLVKDAQLATWTGSYSIRVCEESCNLFVFLPTIIR